MGKTPIDKGAVIKPTYSNNSFQKIALFEPIHLTESVQNIEITFVSHAQGITATNESSQVASR